MELKDLIFDVLGDFTNPNTVQVIGDKILVPFPQAPREFIFDDWNRAVKGTEFEKYKLFVATR